MKSRKSVYHAGVHSMYWEYGSFRIRIWVFPCLQLIKYTGASGTIQRRAIFPLSTKTGNAMKTLENPEPTVCPCLQLMRADITKMTSVSQTIPLVLHKSLVRGGTLTNYSQHAGMLSAQPDT